MLSLLFNCNSLIFIRKWWVIVFLGLFLLNLLIFWPGQISLDSIVQLKEAMMGIYSDHHPPIMALFWRYLLVVFPYTSGLFIFHMLLLYSSCLIFIRALKEYPAKCVYLFYPLFPPIFLYSSMIWKDVGFAFSFLFVSAAITYFVMHNKKPNMLQLFFILLILFYGSAVKFQAIYCAPFMLLGICYIFNNFKLNFKTLIYAVCAYAALFFVLNQFNNFLVPQAKKCDSWKFVKIYDLAGISLDLNRPIFPDYILNYKNFSFDLVKEKFNYERVDDIVFNADSPIPRVETEENRMQLLSLWKETVFRHPVSYLKHRFRNWIRIIFAKPLEKLDTLDFNQFETFSWFAKLQSKGSILAKLVFFLLKAFRYLFSFIFVFIFMIFYLFLGFAKRKSRLGFILLMMNCAALTLVLVLSLFSMASLLRYVYMSVCLVHASHVIAYLLIKTSYSEAIP